MPAATILLTAHRELEKLVASSRMASIFVTHDRYYLENVSTRVAEINRAYPLGLFSVLALGSASIALAVVTVTLGPLPLGRFVAVPNSMNIDAAPVDDGPAPLTVQSEPTGARVTGVSFGAYRACALAGIAPRESSRRDRNSICGIASLDALKSMCE